MATSLEKKLEELKLRIKEFPNTPGVYLMKGAGEKIIYVGKAKDVRSRVRSYFQDKKHQSAKTIYLVNQILTIDYILTKTEVEAFLLEASLIKKHRPKYNIRLKDDKNYPYIRVTINEPFPRLYVSRRVQSDGAYYYGPYTSGMAVRETIKFLNRSFCIRDCTDGFFKTRKRPCLTHQIGRCAAPCVGLIDSENYHIDIKGAIQFLEGRNKQLIKELRVKMKATSETEKYEEAARIRDSLFAIEKLVETQVMVSSKDDLDQDVIAYFGDERGTLIEVLHIRKGRVIGNRSQFIPKLDCNSEAEDPKEWLTSFINQYYEENIIPDQILLPVDLTSDIYKLLVDVFKERQNRRSTLRHSFGSDGTKLMTMAKKNAEAHFKDHVKKQTDGLEILGEIQAKFHLRALPMRIECYDISNFQGRDSVASQVVFEEGIPKKEDYRKYKIKTVEGSNDFASMKEVLERRFKHTEYEDPQLVIVDGGKGQLKLALEALKQIGREDIQVVGMAKARTEGSFTDIEVSSSEERFFLPGRSNPVTFHRQQQALQLLVSIRDEAHRFAITFHRLLRDKKLFESELDAIKGLGEKRRTALLKHFGSVEAIRQANVDEISEVPGINEKLAGEIIEFLNKNAVGNANED
ncbi:MAG: excinuclease ABC subunit UvrC [Bdellovibrionota bacterium]